MKSDNDNQPEQVSDKATVTVFTSINPDILAKRYTLEDGRLKVSPAGAMVVGEAEVVTVKGLRGFTKLLTSLDTSQALAYGRPARDKTKIVSEKAWLEQGRPEDCTPRTRKAFSWPNGTGIMVLDYDPSNTEPLTREQIIDHLITAVPELGDYSMLWWMSASSLIYNKKTDKQLTGIKGQRIYFMVKDAGDIPRAGKALETYCWAAGFGRIEISKAGSKLKRTLFDTSMWQPERIDFAAGASCGKDLEQRRGKPVYIEGLDEVVDTAAVIPEPSAAVMAEAKAAMERAEVDSQDEAKAKREEYLSARALDMAGPNPSPEVVERCRETLVRGLDGGVLAGDFPITVVHSDSTKEDLYVGDVLDNPLEYHGMHTLDPAEPDYQGGKTVGKLYLMGARPTLHSFAHGGRAYKLIRTPENIEVASGYEHETVNRVLDVMRKSPLFFDFGDQLAIIENGEVIPLDENSFRYYLGGIVKFYREKKTTEGIVQILMPPPVPVLKQIMSLGGRRGLKSLKAVVSAPVMRLDGSLLVLPGFDEETGLYLDMDEEDACPVPDNPTKEEVTEAVDRLMKPFEDFPFVGDLDRGVMLSALLTTVVRPVLVECPAFGFDAPMYGSGKTLLAKCVSAMAGDAAGSVWPHVDPRNTEEIRKRILTMLSTGKPVLIWDNLVGTFNNVSIASLLTSEFYVDRKLGESKQISLPNSSIFIFTGNNMMFDKDMSRRVLCSRIDPNTDNPAGREFDFDPHAYCRQYRHRMVADAITILRGRMQCSSKKAPGGIGSFEAWGDIVRQAVAWVGEELGGTWESFEDPKTAIQDAQQSNPEQEELHSLVSSLSAIFGDRRFTGKEIVQAISWQGDFAGAADDDEEAEEARRELKEALLGMIKAANVSSIAVGRALGYRVDRPTDAGKIRKTKDKSSKVTVFWIEGR